MCLSLMIILTLDSARMLSYYGGDAGGSPGLLIVPSAIVYVILGTVVAGTSLIVKLLWH